MEAPVKRRLISLYLLGFLLVISNLDVVFGKASDFNAEIVFPVKEKNYVLNSINRFTESEAAVIEDTNLQVQKRISFNRLREKRSIQVALSDDLFRIYPGYEPTNFTNNEKIPRIANNLFGLYDKVLAIILGFLFGFALDIDKAKVLINGPGPAITFFCKFIFAPMVRYLKKL